MIIMGIDPGTAITGFGVIAVDGMQRQFIDCGVISTEKHLTNAERIHIIHDDLTSLIAKYQPVAVGVEQLFFATNAKTAMSVGQARGVILLTIQQAGIAIYEPTPMQVKQAVAGYGGAVKKQIQEMVRLQLNLSVIPRPDDAADALAIALTVAAVIKKPR